MSFREIHCGRCDLTILARYKDIRGLHCDFCGDVIPEGRSYLCGDLQSLVSYQEHDEDGLVHFWTRACAESWFGSKLKVTELVVREVKL